MLLNITKLKKSFASPEGGTHAVVDVENFTLENKAQVALSGESGSGKTTFLHLIAGILKPDSGAITIAGREMSALSEPERDRLRATTIGYIFQTFNLLQGYTCLENVLLGMSFGPGVDRAFAHGVAGARRARQPPETLSPPAFHRAAAARGGGARPGQPPQTRPGRRTHRQSGPQERAEALALIRDACQENGAALLLVSHDRDVLKQFEMVQRSGPDQPGRRAEEAAV